MTANSPAYAIQASSHSAQLFRQAISTLLGSAGGIVDAGDYQVTQNGTPNMSVNVAGGIPGGRIWIPGTTSANVQGLYYGFNDADVNVPISASNPTNPRIDIIVAQVQDAAYAGAVNSFQIAAVTGTPAGSPVAPSTPASSLKLANVAVAALATTIVTGNITDTRSQAKSGVATESAFSTYKELARIGHSIGAGDVTGTGVYLPSVAGAVAPVSGVTFPPLLTFDPADYSAGTRTTRLRLKVAYAVGGTASGQTATYGLYPVASVSSRVMTLGTVVSGSTVAFSNPAINTIQSGSSGDFTAPASGQYVVGLNNSGAWAGAATALVTAELQMRQT